MPRVSPAHRDARRTQILDAARRCFVRDGFHATSMQDVLAEAGLSAGAVYLYFKSKEEIVEAIAAGTLALFAAAFDELLGGDELPSLEAALGHLLERLLERDREQPTLRVAVQVWGEALRAPRLAALFAEMEGRVQGLLARLVARYQARGHLDPRVPAEQVAQVLAALVMGFVVHCALRGEADVPAFQAGLRATLAAHLHAETGRG